MNPISNNNSSAIMSSPMMEHIKERFQAADVDESGALSKAEVTNALSAKGLDTSRVEKMFERMDANGDGEISLQEHSDMLKAMEERMNKLISKGTSGSGSFDTLISLLEALTSTSEDDDEKDRLQKMLDKLQSEGLSESNLSEAVSILNSIIPPVNIKV